MTLELVLGVVRALGAAVAGYLIQMGITDGETTEQVIGAMVLLATAAWSVFSKVKPTQEFKRAIVQQVKEDKARGIK